MSLGTHSPSGEEKQATPTTEGCPSSGFRACQSRTSDLSIRGAPRVWGPQCHLARQGGGGRVPLQLSPPRVETRLGSCGPHSGTWAARRGLASGFPVARALNSTDGARDAYSWRCARAPKGLVPAVLGRVVPALRSRAVSGPPAGLEAGLGLVGGRGRNAHGRTRGAVSREGGELSERRGSQRSERGVSTHGGEGSTACALSAHRLRRVPRGAPLCTGGGGAGARCCRAGRELCVTLMCVRGALRTSCASPPSPHSRRSASAPLPSAPALIFFFHLGVGTRVTSLCL